MSDHYDELAQSYHDLVEKYAKLKDVTQKLIIEIGEGTSKGRPLDILSRRTVEAVIKELK